MCKIEHVTLICSRECDTVSCMQSMFAVHCNAVNAVNRAIYCPTVHHAVQCSAVQCSAVQCSAVQYSVRIMRTIGMPPLETPAYER